MPPNHLGGTARALYCVFIQPSLSASRPPLRALLRPASAPIQPPFVPLSSRRHKAYMKDNLRQSLTDVFVVDEAIRSRYINLVNTDGFHPAIALRDVLHTFDRTVYHLVQVAPGSTNNGPPSPDDPASLPTCKLQSKQELREQQKVKLALKNKAKTKGGAGVGGPSKQLEINWAIDANDLRHRLTRMKEFLGQGRKVEVILAPKKTGRRATVEEVQAVVKKVKDAAGECKGVVEAKDPKGKIGGVFTMVFEGKLIEKEGKE